MNFQINKNNYTFETNIELSDNNYSTELIKKIEFSNLKNDDIVDKSVDIRNLAVYNMLNHIFISNYFDFDELNFALKGNDVIGSPGEKQSLYKTLGLPIEWFNQMYLHIGESVKNNLRYQNIPGIDWAIPFRVKCSLKPEIEIKDIEPYTFIYYGENCWTEIKVSKDVYIDSSSQFKYSSIYIESNMVNMMPVLSNNDREKMMSTSGMGNRFVLNKYFMKMMSYFIQFSNNFEFVDNKVLNKGQIINVDDQFTSNNVYLKNDIAKYVLKPSNKKVNSIIQKWFKDALIPNDLMENIEIQFYETSETKYKKGSYSNIIFHPTGTYLVFDFEPKTYNGVTMELIRENGKNTIKLSNIFCPTVDVI